MDADGWLTRGCKAPCIGWSQGQKNLFTAAMGDKSAMRPFAKNYFGHLLKQLLALLISVVTYDEHTVKELLNWRWSFDC